MKKNRGGARRNGSSISLIFFWLDLLGEKFYSALVNGFFGKIFTSYSSMQNTWDHGVANRYLFGTQNIRDFFRAIRQYLAKSFEESGFVRFIQKIGKQFIAIPLKTCGNFFLFFGFYTVLIYVLRRLFPSGQGAELSSVLIGILCCCVGLIMSRSHLSLAQAIGEGKISCFLFVHLFGFRMETMETPPQKNRTLSVFMNVMGMLFGVLTVIVSPGAILLGLLSLVAISLLLAMPEIGVLLSVFSLPFLYWFESPSITLGMMILATAISYLIKIIRGKRIFRFELIDLAILLFFVIMFLSGAFSAGGQNGINEILLSCVLIFGYFMTVNLLRTRSLLNRCSFGLMISGTVTSVLGILQYLTQSFHSGAWLDPAFHSSIDGRVDALFDNPNILAAFLVLTLPFALSFLVQAKGLRERLVCLFSILSILTCIVFTWCRAAWIAVLIELLLFATIYTKKTFRYVVLTCVSIPFLAFLLPSSVTKRFMSIGNLADTSISYRIYTWKGSWRLAKDYLLSGIGYGNEAYRELYPMYAYAGIEAAEHSHSLYMQLLIGLGLVGLVVLLSVVFLFFQMNLEHLSTTKKSKDQMMIVAAICAIVAHLIMGIFDFVWFSYRIFFLFWVIIGLACAYTRLDQEELRRNECKGNEKENTATLDFIL